MQDSDLHGKKIENDGKICFYNGLLFVSEPEVAIHIPDNGNHPKSLCTGFVELLMTIAKPVA
jgi:hypothetical protein